MQTYPIIPETKEIKQESKFTLFGIGNEKRDLVLLTRGDIKIDSPVCVSFFGCINCGYMATGSAGFYKTQSKIVDQSEAFSINKKVYCTRCESVDTVYYFDGVWKGCWGEIVEGTNESKITVSKM